MRAGLGRGEGQPEAEAPQHHGGTDVAAVPQRLLFRVFQGAELPLRACDERRLLRRADPRQGLSALSDRPCRGRRRPCHGGGHRRGARPVCPAILAAVAQLPAHRHGKRQHGAPCLPRKDRRAARCGHGPACAGAAALRRQSQLYAQLRPRHPAAAARRHGPAMEARSSGCAAAYGRRAGNRAHPVRAGVPAGIHESHGCAIRFARGPDALARAVTAGPAMAGPAGQAAAAAPADCHPRADRGGLRSRGCRAPGGRDAPAAGRPARLCPAAGAVRPVRGPEAAESDVDE